LFKITLSAFVWVRSFSPPDPPRSRRFFERQETPSQLGEEPWRQETVGDGAVIAIAHASQIGTRPLEQIALGQHHPGPLGIETQVSLDRRRQFQRGIGSYWWGMRHRHYDHSCGVIAILDSEHDGTGPILAAFLAALAMFVPP
jgi:hypothetical protein